MYKVRLDGAMLLVRRWPFYGLPQIGYHNSFVFLYRSTIRNEAGVPPLDIGLALSNLPTANKQPI
jgi:hypothetical protein